MHSGTAGGSKHPKLYVTCSNCYHDNIASWEVHIKNYAYDLVNLSLVLFLISKDRSAVEMRACRYCRTPILENHRDDMGPDDRILNVLVIYWSLTSI